jgi:hypothetical protein
MAMNTGMMPVFEEKFKKLLKKIEREYEKPKAERNKDFLKKTAKEARDLRKLLKECRKEMGTQCCPNCGCEINI